MIEFTFEFGPLRIRFAVAEPEDETEREGAASGGGVYSTVERVDYPLSDADYIGFRAKEIR